MCFSRSLIEKEAKAIAFPYRVDSKCGLTGEELRRNWPQRHRETEEERGQDNYKFDILRRVWKERLTIKESIAKCGLPDETEWAWEKKKWERRRERVRLYLNVSLPVCELRGQGSCPWFWISLWQRTKLSSWHWVHGTELTAYTPPLCHRLPIHPSPLLSFWPHCHPLFVCHRDVTHAVNAA